LVNSSCKVSTCLRQLCCNKLQLGLGNAQLAQNAQQFGAGLYGQARAGGLDFLLGSGLGQANLMGNVGAGLLSGLFSGGGNTLKDKDYVDVFTEFDSRAY
jgi:hypothetical protein